jgi:hypothetical protein
MTEALCACGCGKPTTLVKQNNPKRGMVKGRPNAYLKGHNPTRLAQVFPPPNPEGRCMCGCGAETPRAVTHHPPLIVRGEHVRFVKGHGQRQSPVEWVEDPESGCWIWQLTRGPRGYGEIRVDGKSRRAHRVVYARFHDDLSPDMDLHHTCFNRLCVNPAHLQQLSKSDHAKHHQELLRAA